MPFRRHVIAGAVLLCTVAVGLPAEALQYRVVESPQGRILHATGPFERGDAARLAQFLRNNRGIDVVMFQSPGGVAVEGMAVGRVIRQAGLATHLASGVLCGSACTYAFLGGRLRTADAGARYCVHMFSASESQYLKDLFSSLVRENQVSGFERFIREVESFSAQLAAQLAYYSVEMGVSLGVLDPNFHTDHTKMRCLNARELRQFNVVNAD